MIDNAIVSGRSQARRARIRTSLVMSLLVTLGAVFAVTSSPAAQAADCSAGYVGLTYDDGPNPGNTANLLNALRQNGLRATMFNTGQNAQNNQALVRAQRDAGMWIGNHSYTHPHLTGMSGSQMQSELQRTQQAIQQATGTAPRLFRPPYGETNATLRSVAQQLGLTEIIWDVDSQDWNGAGTAQIVQAAGRLQNGQIILMHDQYATTLNAIPQIAANLRSRNLCAGMISPTTGRVGTRRRHHPDRPADEPAGRQLHGERHRRPAVERPVQPVGRRLGKQQLDRHGDPAERSARHRHLERQPDLGRQRQGHDDAAQRQRQHLRLHRPARRRPDLAGGLLPGGLTTP